MTSAQITKAAADAAGNTFNALALDVAGDGSKIALVHALINSVGAIVDPAASSDIATLHADLAALKAVLSGSPAVNTTPSGLGALQPVPAASASGTALGTPPAGSKGVRLYLPAGASVTFTVASAAPTAAPASTFTASQAGTGPNWDEDLSGGQMIYVTGTVGAPLFRWN